MYPLPFCAAFQVSEMDPDEPTRVLVIDGGGVKGCASIAFLAKLDEALQATGSTVLETFDVFAGTSSGALIICAMVYGGLSPRDIMTKYFSQSALEAVFPRSVRDEILGLVQLKPKYNGRGKREMIDSTISADRRIRDTNKLVMVTGYDVDAQKPVLYSSFSDHNADDHVLVREVMDISSSAPAYFPMVVNTSTGSHRRCVDGAVFANNPTDSCYAQVIKEFGTGQDIRILSVGTGTQPPTKPSRLPTNAGGIQWMEEGHLFNMLYDGPQFEVHERMKTFSEAMGHTYIRVNGPVSSQSLDNIDRANIEALAEEGDEWWANNGALVWQRIILGS